MGLQLAIRRSWLGIVSTEIMAEAEDTKEDADAGSYEEKKRVSKARFVFTTVM